MRRSRILRNRDALNSAEGRGNYPHEHIIQQVYHNVNTQYYAEKAQIDKYTMMATLACQAMPPPPP